MLGLTLDLGTGAEPVTPWDWRQKTRFTTRKLSQ